MAALSTGKDFTQATQLNASAYPHILFSENAVGSHLSSHGLPRINKHSLTEQCNTLCLVAGFVWKHERLLRRRMNVSEFSQQTYYSVAEALEATLGDPSASDTLFSFHHAVELDEREEFPAEQCRLLEEWGLQDYYVPLQYGGKMRRFDEMLALVRVVSRRDLSVAIAHCKTMLGASPVWIAGTEEQRRTLARA